jgi:hypothetical protein
MRCAGLAPGKEIVSALPTDLNKSLVSRSRTNGALLLLTLTSSWHGA